ncbi:MAG: hypothetical protein KKD44_29040 [Proteobacteria bacterium]|nr:hypothetical protein [Pseudomonadota bacterium]
MADYTTVANVKLEIGKTQADHDAILALMVTAASAAIDRWCRRPDGFIALSTATARTYAGLGLPYLLIDECATVSTVAAKDAVDDTAYTAWDPTDWLAFAGGPENPNFNRLPYTGIMVAAGADYSVFLDGRQSTWVGFRPVDSKVSNRMVPTVQVTAKWGYAASCPAAIAQACIMQTARWYKRGLSAFADTVASQEFGQLLYRQKLDPDVEAILSLGGYVRPLV